MITKAQRLALEKLASARGGEISSAAWDAASGTVVLIRAIDYCLELAGEKLAKFAEDFRENPAYAFDWGDAAVEAAARKKVYSHARRMLSRSDEPVSPQDLLAAYRRDMLTAAQYPTRSTSPMSNALKQAELAAIAEAVSLFGAHCESGESK